MQNTFSFLGLHSPIPNVKISRLHSTEISYLWQCICCCLRLTKANEVFSVTEAPTSHIQKLWEPLSSQLTALHCSRPPGLACHVSRSVAIITPCVVVFVERMYHHLFTYEAQIGATKPTKSVLIVSVVNSLCEWISILLNWIGAWMTETTVRGM